MKKLIFTFSVALLMALSTGCNSQKQGSSANEEITSEQNSSGELAEEESVSDDEELAQELERRKSKGKYPQLEEVQKGETVATISTNMGDIKVRFFPEYAPKAVENFVTHAKEGYYDGVIFHRVINDFMIQGGDPDGNGTGGESIWGEPFEIEVTADLKHIRGALCMAKTSEPVSIGSQFYIVQNKDIGDEYKAAFKDAIQNQDEEIPDTNGAKFKEFYPAALLEEYINNGGYPYLDFNYTVFGQVYEGMDVVDKIAAVETDENDKPNTDVIINKIEVSEY